MKKILTLVASLMLIGSLFLTLNVSATGTATATLVPNTTSVEKGELFTITL